MNTLQQASNAKDLDAACLIIQNAIGQTDGDVAGMHFSGNNKAQDFWEDASPALHEEWLREYLELEVLYGDTRMQGMCRKVMESST
jgi:hypothetical protein